MQRVFVDTSAWLALRDQRHAVHRPLVDWLSTFHGRLVTTSDVIDETVTWATRRWGHAVAVSLGERMMDDSEVQVVFIGEEFFAAGWELFQARTDKGYSLTDCTSFAVMKRMEFQEAATLDRHFMQEGFRVIPAGLS